MKKFTDFTRFLERNLAVLAVFAITPAVAHADLIGDTVNGEIIGGPGAFQVVPPSNTVGAGIEFTIEFVGTPAFEVDIDANSITVTQVFGQPISTGAGEVLFLSDLDWVGPSGPGRIIGIANFETDEGPDITESDVTWTDDEIFFNMSPNIWANGSFARWDLVVEHACPWDLDNDGIVGVGDLLQLFANWGTPGPGDFNNDGIVGVGDLLIMFANWGPCPR